jgi:hypothetical protein
MIRRDMRLPDGGAGWMLISQVEHARISADLATHCIAQFSMTQRAGASQPLALSPSARNELLNAIRHHDDGWRDWERAPQLDSKLGRPLAFTELPPADAVAIWSRSVDAAAEFGPLAAATVAGHFLRLASKSDATRANAAVVTWRTDMQPRRDAWLAMWAQRDPQLHTQDAADEALQWLWTFDEVSLWFCCTCMPDERSIPCAPQAHRAGRDTPVEMQLLAASEGFATVEPWRFDDPAFDLHIEGGVVPARVYAEPAELLAASVPMILHWRAKPV